MADLTPPPKPAIVEVDKAKQLDIAERIKAIRVSFAKTRESSVQSGTEAADIRVAQDDFNQALPFQNFNQFTNFNDFTNFNNFTNFNDFTNFNNFGNGG
jgi:hypothetical protein